jgi:two-component system CheB/CheR fusion protein
MATVSRKVLLVDDNPDAVAVIAAFLRRVRPDFVFLDLGLPGLDGLGVARQLRADPQLGRMRIVAVTGSGREDDRQGAMDAGCDQYLLKPLDLDFVRSLLG